MKTKTQEQLEKEIEKLDNEIQKYWKPSNKYHIRRINRMKVLQAKLSQHLTDIKNFEKLIDKENIYPTDIFPEIHEELFEEINQELQNKFEFPLDRLSAQICRKILSNQKEALKEL